MGGGNGNPRFSGSILRTPVKNRSNFHSPSSSEDHGSNTNRVSWNHNIKTSFKSREKKQNVVTEEQDMLGDSLDADAAHHYVAKEEKQEMIRDVPMNSNRRLSAKWDRLISQKQRKRHTQKSKDPNPNPTPMAELDSRGDSSENVGRGETRQYTFHDSNRGDDRVHNISQGGRRRESLVGRGMRRTREAFGNFGPARNIGSENNRAISGRDPSPEQQPNGSGAGEYARQQPNKRRSLVGRASDALRSRNQSRDPDGVYGGREGMGMGQTRTEQQPTRQARPKKRESILNIMISFASKSENKHEHEEEEEKDELAASDNEHTISGTDQALHYGTPLHEPGRSKSRRSRGSLTDLIISITTKNKSDRRRGSDGEEIEDDDSFEVEETKVEETGEGVEEAPVKRDSQQPRARKRGSIVNMVNNIKNMRTKSSKDEALAGDDQQLQQEEGVQRSKSSRGRRSHRNTKDKVRSSVNLFDRVAKERYRQRGSLIFRKSNVEPPRESTVSTADEPGTPYSQRTTISTSYVSSNREVNEEEKYQEKISSILYDRQTV